ncbi:MAG: hypothetical protein R6X02_03050 [Enhygromyxa sp.]
MRPLPRPRLPTASWLSPAIAAAAWWGVLTTVADQPIATVRSLVFLGGPLLLLAGLHGRLFGFLHAPDRARWLPLPIAPERHFAAALSSHRPAFWLTSGLGLAALLLAGPVGVTASGLPAQVGLALEFAWLVVFAAALEPFVAGLSAQLGRRFPEGSRAHELQRNLGGGWTTAEAVVHLYAPAFGLGLAVLLAMPGQLSWEHYLDHGALNIRHLIVGTAPLLVALVLRVAARPLYRRGIWEAVPWLVEASRTLAGPPRPESTPAWAARIRDPWTRLLVIQFWRITPLPGLRLALLLGSTALVVARATPPSAAAMALWLAVVGAWLVPAGALARDRLARARLAGALPLSAARRSGRAGSIALAALLAPVLLASAVLAGRMVIEAHPAPPKNPVKSLK